MAETSLGAASQVGLDHRLSTATARVDRRKVAGRSRAGRLAASLRAELLANVGGNPSPLERELAERTVQVRLRLFESDRRFEATGQQDPTYPSLVEAYASLLAQLTPPHRAIPHTNTNQQAGKPCDPVLAAVE